VTDDELNEKKREFVKVDSALKRVGLRTPGPQADELRKRHRELFVEVTEENQRLDREAVRPKRPTVYGSPSFGVAKKKPNLTQAKDESSKPKGEDPEG
jgi:hypothetical protein